MLRELQVSGYRSLRNIELPFDQLTVVSGPNGTGKTNLYSALQLLSAAAGGTLAHAMLGQGGLPSALWAGPRRKQESHRIEIFTDLTEYSYELQVGNIPPAPGDTYFLRDPDVKEERLKVDGHVVAERRGAGAWSRDHDGKRNVFTRPLWGGESMLAQIIEPQRFLLLADLRARLLSWRFYHSFRTDAEAPARHAQMGVRTPALAHDGRDLAAALATIQQIGDAPQMEASIDRAFPGARLEPVADEGRFSFLLHMPGLLRPLEPAEASDGTLRFLYLLAALLSPRPPPFLALNEPETSLHEGMLDALAELISAAATRGQIFLVTHSERLARGLQGAAVHALSKDGGATVLASREEHEIEPVREASGVQRVRLQSSMLAQVAYDESVQTLEVLFRNGRTYLYFDVPPEVWRELIAAQDEGGSAGEYFNQRIRTQYRYDKP
jgi:predicted ATPase